MNSDWRNRLQGDPAPWLLDADDNPSIYFWFQRDIVGRPEDAAALIAAREKILYSAPVQQVFAAQNERGYWSNPESLDEPRHRATVWSLALLAELGVPRNSRRARAACEFVLQNHLREDRSFDLADASVAGILLRALFYFNYRDDPRLARAKKLIAPAARRGNIFALWALADASNVMLSEAKHLVIRKSNEQSNEPTRPFANAQRDNQHDLDELLSSALARGAEAVLKALGRGEYKIFGAFPSFDPLDALLALRVLAQLHRASDERAKEMVEQVWKRQGEGARWALEKSYNGSVAAELDIAQVPSKWATLNVLRIVTKM